MIPQRSNAKKRQEFFPKMLYKGRARIEQAVGKLERSNVWHYAGRKRPKLQRYSRFRLRPDLSQIRPQDLSTLATLT